jgi:4-amino-4-deoxy-L-arabinose transferase-like glycosyltransferase
VLAAALRLYQLGAENLWIDEVFSIHQALDPVMEIRGYWDFESQATSRPLSLILLYWVLQLGESEFLMRLPYAILSVLDVAAVYLLSRELVERHVALRASLFLALLPIHVFYAQEVRWYAQWALLATVSFLALVRLWKTGRPAWWVAYAVTAIICLYTYVVSLQLLAMQALSAWLLPSRGSRWSFRWKAGAALALAALAALPVFYAALSLRAETSSGMVGTPRETSPVALPYLFFTYVAGYTIGPTVGELHALPSPARILTVYPEIVLYYVVFMPIAALGLWSLRRRSTCAAILAPWVAGMPLLVFASAIVGGQTFNVRYTFAAVPGFALLLSLGVESLGRWKRVGTVAAAGLFALSLVNYYTDPRYDKEDVRGALRVVRSSPFRELPVAVVGQGTSAAAYYGTGLDLRRLLGCGRQGEARDRSPLRDMRIEELRTEPAVWIMVSRDWQDRAERCSEKLSDSHRVVRRQGLTGVNLYRLERR